MSKTSEEIAKLKDEYKVAIDTYNDVAKQMLEEAVRIMSPQNQLADASKVMNSPEKQDSCEHILDMEKMVDVDKVMFCVYCNDMHKGNCAVGKGKNHPALTQPQWISVKDRLPPPETKVLWWNKTAHQAGVSSWEYMSHCNDTRIYWGDAGNVSIKNFTHWMPLPKQPKE